MAHDVTFLRSFDNVLASARADGLYVIAGWTVAIDRESAVRYATTFNQSSSSGFVKINDEQVAIAHHGARLMLTNAEANAVIALIKEAYGVA